MYLFVDKKTNAVVHVANASPGDDRKPEDIFPAFDPATMSVGRATEAFIPAHFAIENGVVKDLDRPAAAPAETLAQARERKLREFSGLGLALRARLIPDHQLLNAGLGLYDDDRVQGLRATVQAFRDEYQRMEAKVARAGSLKELDVLQPAFPTAPVAPKPSPAPAKPGKLAAGKTAEPK